MGVPFQLSIAGLYDFGEAGVVLSAAGERHGTWRLDWRRTTTRARSPYVLRRRACRLIGGAGVLQGGGVLGQGGRSTQPRVESRVRPQRGHGGQSPFPVVAVPLTSVSSPAGGVVFWKVPVV